MTKRRDFLKKVGLGAAAAGMSGWNGVVNAADITETPVYLAEVNDFAEQSLSSEWIFNFDDNGSLLILKNGLASLSGKLTFISGDDVWKITLSRDGVADRYALVDTRDNENVTK